MPTSDRGSSSSQPVEPLRALAAAIVAVYKAKLGRGPAHASAEYAGENTIICTLEQSLSAIEATMLQHEDGPERIRQLRTWFQYSDGKVDFVNAVEEITGRTVRGFVSGTDIDHDISTEVFYLEPLARG